MYQLLRHLHQHHEIWCLSLAPSTAAIQAAEPLKEFCTVQFFPAPQRSLSQRAQTTLLSALPDMALRAPSASLSAALAALLQTTPIDFVQACSIEMGQYALQAQQQGLPAALDQWNAEYLLQRRAALTDLRQPQRLHAGIYSLIQWHKLARYERMLGSTLDLMTVVSAEDQRALQRIGVHKPLPIVPNGVDTTYFTPAKRTPEANTLLFTGSLDFRPNIDALRWFVQQVLPLIQHHMPQARLKVVGRSPTAAVTQLAHPGRVEIIGGVPDVRPYFAQAQAFVLPMRIGGGVRLKLLEAFAAGVPLISTPMGADGVEGLRNNEHCLLRDDPVGFAMATIDILRNPEQAQRLAAAARQLVVDHYDWSVIAPRLERAWQACFSTPRP